MFIIILLILIRRNNWAGYVRNKLLHFCKYLFQLLVLPIVLNIYNIRLKAYLSKFNLLDNPVFELSMCDQFKLLKHI